jgi:DNA-binding transcriptional ArsR family regulator
VGDSRERLATRPRSPKEPKSNGAFIFCKIRGGARGCIGRRGVLEQLGGADASITDLAQTFHMTLTGVRKHVGVLEQAGLVSAYGISRVVRRSRERRTQRA